MCKQKFYFRLKNTPSFFDLQGKNYSLERESTKYIKRIIVFKIPEFVNDFPISLLTEKPWIESENTITSNYRQVKSAEMCSTYLMWKCDLWF
ncbi:hypothetical protein RIR_jg29700.t2 [Rhizophagus irregularis DAOM 181602=DAOM 197198]|nr:hypothetical protein RIR_jg29700.t2 [Rhizophagus irregularis DAOM 181602=DAOM 197198]